MGTCLPTVYKLIKIGQAVKKAMTHLNTKQPKALRLAEHLEKFRSSPDDIAAASELRYQHDLLIEFAYQLSGSKARIAELEAQLSAIGAGGVEPLRKLGEDGWIQDGHLLYRLTDERRPRNRDEINVTMANSSRTEEARTRRAGELLDAIRAAAQVVEKQGDTQS